LSLRAVDLCLTNEIFRPQGLHTVALGDCKAQIGRS
jgi:hypothetical protein